MPRRVAISRARTSATRTGCPRNAQIRKQALCDLSLRQDIAVVPDASPRGRTAKVQSTMATRSAAPRGINIAVQKGRKETQLERLLSGMVAAANRGGYAGASVSAVIAEAGVSRPTFYEYFADRDECFLAALADAQEQLAASVDEAVASQAAGEALQAALSAVLGFAISEPARARLLMSEAMAAGTRALDARDQGIERLARSVEKAYAREAVEEAVADVPAAIVIGGVYRLLAA